MKKISRIATLMLATACGSSSSDKDASTDADAGSVVESDASTVACGSASTETAAIVNAANTFLATLSAEQLTKGKLVFDRPAASSAGDYSGRLGEQYGAAQWSNYPVSDVPRPGLVWATLSEAQQAAETTLLQTALSASGYQKILDIMGADQVLADQGQNFDAGRDTYTLAIFGTPSTSEPWMIEFGGHHLGLNIVIDSDRGTIAPTLTGAQPAVYQRADGTTVRALAAENDKAFALLNALDESQRAQATLSYDVRDLVLGPGHQSATLVPEGIKASAMTAAQRSLLVDLISEWSGILHSGYSCARLTELQAGLDETYFAWSGATTHAEGKNGSSYYRIQGPKVVIEFSPQGVGGDPTMHVHTVYRDPTNDYGHTW